MSNSNQMDDESWDNFWYGLGAVVFIGPLVLWSRFVGLLVEHQVLAPASADPLLTLPHADGAGLDVQRLVLVVGVALGVIAGLVLISRRRRARSEEASQR